MVCRVLAVSSLICLRATGHTRELNLGSPNCINSFEQMWQRCFVGLDMDGLKDSRLRYDTLSLIWIILLCFISFRRGLCGFLCDLGGFLLGFLGILDRFLGRLTGFNFFGFRCGHIL